MPREAKSQVGLVLQVRPRSRWTAPDVPEFDPNWIAEFRFPGRAPKRESTHLPVCEDCITDRSKGLSLNDRCGCRRDARRIAETRFLALQAGWLTDKMEVQEWSRKHAEFSVGAVVTLFQETLQRTRQPAAEADIQPFLQRADEALSELLNLWKAQKLPAGFTRLSLRTVRQTYERSSLASREENLTSLKLFYESVSGKALDDGFADELDANWTRRFAVLYQEYGRRGWSVRGNAPKDAWAQLRAMQPPPPIDWETPASWNTTIKSTLARVKAIFGGDSMEKYLHELTDQMPDMRGFRECSLSLPTPDNRDAMTLNQHDAMMAALPALLRTQPDVWVLIRLAMLAPLRSIELLAAQVHWIEQDERGQALLVVQHRPAEGFLLKDRKSRSVREIPLPSDMLEVISRLAPAGGSIYGVAAPLRYDETKKSWSMVSEIDALYRRANLWVREGGYVSEESGQVLYVLGRKTGATVRARLHGADASRVALGHAKGSTVAEECYIEGRVRLDTVSTEETRSVLNKPRVPWVPASAAAGA